MIVDQALVVEFRRVIDTSPTYGVRRITAVVRRLLKAAINRKRVHRIIQVSLDGVLGAPRTPAEGLRELPEAEMYRLREEVRLHRMRRKRQDVVRHTWETWYGTDPATPSNNLVGQDGYTALELYLQWLIDPGSVAPLG